MDAILPRSKFAIPNWSAIKLYKYYSEAEYWDLSEEFAFKNENGISSNSKQLPLSGISHPSNTHQLGYSSDSLSILDEYRGCDCNFGNVLDFSKTMSHISNCKFNSISNSRSSTISKDQGFFDLREALPTTKQSEYMDQVSLAVPISTVGNLKYEYIPNAAIENMTSSNITSANIELQTKVIKYSSGSIACLSFVSCLLCILTILLCNCHKLRRHISMRIILFLLICNLFSSSAYIIHLTDLDQQESLLCSMEGVLMTIFELCAVSWTCILSFHIMLSIYAIGSKYEKCLNLLEIFYHLIVWIPPVVWSFLLLMVDQFKMSSTGWCWVKGPDNGSIISVYRLLSFIPIEIAMVFNFSMVFVFLFLYIYSRRSINKGFDSQLRNKTASLISLRLSLFVFIFFIVWTPTFVNRFYEIMFLDEYVYPLQLAQAISNPAAGFLNAIVFGLTMETWNNARSVVDSLLYYVCCCFCISRKKKEFISKHKLGKMCFPFLPRMQERLKQFQYSRQNQVFWLDLNHVKLFIMHCLCCFSIRLSNSSRTLAYDEVQNQATSPDSDDEKCEIIPFSKYSSTQSIYSDDGFEFYQNP